SFTTAAGTTLVTEGTYAQPVVFSSYRDDEFGGDTNRDADASEADKAIEILDSYGEKASIIGKVTDTEGVNIILK
ncbi:MAG: hypothetical protein II172_02605, partial [Bacteroidales bacterium]|nr:hypothetical protein [Bacteroidales bacterium]